MRNGLVTLVLVVGTAALLYLWLFNDQRPDTIPYSGHAAQPESFLTRVANGEVKSVLAKGDTLEITLNATDPNDGSKNVVVESFLPAQFTTSLQADINLA